MTQLQAIGEDAANEIREFSRKTMVEMLEVPGFLGTTGAKIGLRMITLSAWTDQDALIELMKSGTHAGAMREFFKGMVAESGYTSLWAPSRINAYWVGCISCGEMQDI